MPVRPYLRPPVAQRAFSDERGEPIPYGHRWAGGLPPDESYSAVSNPERFAPLHDVARAIIQNLEETYDVSVRNDPAIAAGFSSPEHIVSTVELAPRHPDADTLVVAFTDFPGVRLRVGASNEAAFPACGCDACDDDLDQLLGQLEQAAFDAAAGASWDSAAGRRAERRPWPLR